MRLTALAHQYLSGTIRCGDLAIDATMGNGHDTCFLAHQVGANGQVIAFDVQQAALEATRERLAGMGLLQRVRLLHASHEELSAHLPAGACGDVACATFNLGYLPGSDKLVTTKPSTTIRALGQALDALRVGGLATVLVYVGHQNGAQEYEVVQGWLAKKIGRKGKLYTHRGEADHSPVLHVIERTAE